MGNEIHMRPCAHSVIDLIMGEIRDSGQIIAYDFRRQGMPLSTGCNLSCSPCYTENITQSTQQPNPFCHFYRKAQTTTSFNVAPIRSVESLSHCTAFKFWHRADFALAVKEVCLFEPRLSRSGILQQRGLPRWWHSQGVMFSS